MAYNVVILADSVSPRGKRLTTMELTYPRIIHAEMMTHRMFSRNAASSRAIPTKKIRKAVWDNPFIPTYLGKNQAGMQAKAELTGWRRWAAIQVWIAASRIAVFVSWLFELIGLHKQLANRVLEPFQWYTAIFTATEWDNFFALRCHPDAQPEIQTIAVMMREAREASTPKRLAYGEWHLPLTPDLADLQQAFGLEDIVSASVGRCARVTHVTHNGVRDAVDDIAMTGRLTTAGHMSPLEHAATPADDDEFYGNLCGWVSRRKMIPNEHDFSLVTKAVA